MGRLRFCRTLFGNRNNERATGIVMNAATYRGRLPARTSSVAKRLLTAFAITTAIIPAAQAAGLAGDTINLTYYFPSLSDVNSSSASGVTPTATFNNDDVGGRGNASVSSDAISLTFDTGGGTWTPAAFNGPCLYSAHEDRPKDQNHGRGDRFKVQHGWVNGKRRNLHV